jgi:arylformamidase
MFDFKEVHDISVCLGKEEITYPGDPEYKREMILQLGSNGAYELSRLSLSSHSGTHLDAPAHFIREGKKIHELEPGRFILPARVIEIQNPKEITRDELKTAFHGSGGALLFKTMNSTQGRIERRGFSVDYVYLTPEAARYCVEKKVTLVGTDYITIDKAGGGEYEAHHILLGNGVIILESINLKHVTPGRYSLLCLPLKIYNGEASPVRAVLLR